MLGWLVAWLGLPSGWSSAGLQPPGYQGCFQLPFLYPPSQTLVPAFTCAFPVPVSTDTTPEPEWAAPWLSCLVLVLRLSSLPLTPVPVL